MKFSFHLNIVTRASNAPFDSIAEWCLQRDLRHLMVPGGQFQGQTCLKILVILANPGSGRTSTSRWTRMSIWRPAVPKTALAPKKIPCRPQLTVLCQFTCRNADTDRADSGSSWPMGRQGRCEKDQNGPSHQPVSISIPARELTKPWKFWMARDSACCQLIC